MLRRWTVVMGVVGAFFAVGAQTAAAEWYDKGVALKAGENKEVHMKGTLAFTSSQGGVHCETGTIKIKLTGGTTAGDVTVFGVENDPACEVTGGLAFLCGGATGIKEILPEGLFQAQNSGGTTITLTAITLKYECSNGFTFTLSSIAGQPIVGTPDNSKAMTKVAFGGMLNTTLGVKATFASNMTMVGADSGTYGVAK